MTRYEFRQFLKSVKHVKNADDTMFDSLGESVYNKLGLNDCIEKYLDVVYYYYLGKNQQEAYEYFKTPSEKTKKKPSGWGSNGFIPDHINEIIYNCEDRTSQEMLLRFDELFGILEQRIIDHKKARKK